VFPPSFANEPFVAHGNLAKLCHAIGKLQMIQTTVPVHPGNSGGPLMNTRGECVGLVTSNAMSKDGILSRLNFAIPSTLLIELRDLLLRDEKRCFAELEKDHNMELSDMWNLTSSRFEGLKSPKAEQFWKFYSESKL
jgi:hypothetical protein